MFTILKRKTKRISFHSTITIRMTGREFDIWKQAFYKFLEHKIRPSYGRAKKRRKPYVLSYLKLKLWSLRAMLIRRPKRSRTSTARYKIWEALLCTSLNPW